MLNHATNQQHGNKKKVHRKTHAHTRLHTYVHVFVQKRQFNERIDEFIIITSNTDAFSIEFTNRIDLYLQMVFSFCFCDFPWCCHKLTYYSNARYTKRFFFDFKKNNNQIQYYKSIRELTPYRSVFFMVAVIGIVIWNPVIIFG